MSHFVATFREFFFGRTKEHSVDPVYRFFFEASSGERKKVYTKALQKAQTEQEKVSLDASRKIRA